MEFQDKDILCFDCNSLFMFTAGEQNFYFNKQLREPRRCKACRDARKAMIDPASRTYPILPDNRGN